MNLPLDSGFTPELRTAVFRVKRSAFAITKGGPRDYRRVADFETERPAPVSRYPPFAGECAVAPNPHPVYV